MISGSQLQAFRESKGWTLYQLKQATGIHQGLLARVEKGTVKNLSEHHEAAICAVMDGREPSKDPRDFIAGLSVEALKAQWEKERPRDVVEALPPRQSVSSLEAAAEIVADHVTSCDPTWGSRLEIMMAERGFTTLQAVTTCVAYVLEQGLQMMIVKHDSLEPSPWRRGSKMECPQCHTTYSPGYPGQPYCGNSCAEQWRRALVV